VVAKPEQTIPARIILAKEIQNPTTKQTPETRPAQPSGRGPKRHWLLAHC
jgi:hypothetical protein